MRRHALIAVCMLALLGIWNTQVQSAEPDNAEIVELRKLLQQSIERIASLEAQVAELKRGPDRSVTEPTAQRTRSQLSDDDDAPPSERYDQGNDSPRFPRFTIRKSQPKEETNTSPRSRFDDSIFADEEASEPTAEARSRRATPKITAPTQIVPKHWQRLEMNGKAYYVVPADEILGGVSSERSSRYMRDE
jgi:hypothetical protein